MKKLLALLLVLVFVFSLAACGKNDSTNDLSSEPVLADAVSSETSTTLEQSGTTTSTESKPESTPSKPTSTNSSKVSSTGTSSVQSKPSTPTKLNPKKDFKYGKYTAKFYSADKKTYTESILIFNKEYESLQYECATYYTREECERLYGGDFGFDADNLTEDFPVITLNGVKYYTFYPAYTILPSAFEITDTVIKISADYEKWGTLSLNANGTLVIDKTDDEPRYGKVGTVYTLVEE